ncbi:unnamed protein product [Paramecium sonneborni]|uniref:Uncharacterized protein n=1 Tax=Paramecium sonneborni TaxID=65129 RepID=A0A8S1RW01_9CILI|nr:unnamed protein product [Paramecium sonneborni]
MFQIRQQKNQFDFKQIIYKKILKQSISRFHFGISYEQKAYILQKDKVIFEKLVEVIGQRDSDISESLCLSLLIMQKFLFCGTQNSLFFLIIFHFKFKQQGGQLSQQLFLEFTDRFKPLFEEFLKLTKYSFESLCQDGRKKFLNIKIKQRWRQRRSLRHTVLAKQNI